jgi:hypothetical protein
MGLSIRAYARHRGVSDTAVHKAIRTGRITPEADGTIDPQRADRDWAKNSDSPREGTARRAETVAVKEPASEPAAPTFHTGGASLLQARTVNEVVKAQTNKVRLARLKGDLVDRAQAIAHVFKLARAERDAWLNWPARSLGADGVASSASIRTRCTSRWKPPCGSTCRNWARCARGWIDG